MRKPFTQTRAIADVLIELKRARKENAPFQTAHHGWAVIWEEFDELWDEVKLKRSVRSKRAMRKEAIQVAAMAVRFVEDICDKEGK